MINNSRRVAAGVVVAAMTVALAAFFGCRNAASQGPAPFQGVVEFEERQLGFELGGRITEITVTRGSRVKKDDVIAHLDESLEEAQRATRESEVKAARAQVAVVEAGSRPEEIRSLQARIRAAQATEDLLKKNLDRETKLHERGVTPQATIDEIVGQLDRATGERESLEQTLRGLKKGARNEEVASAQARAEATESAVKLEDVRIGRHELRAPEEGDVLDVHVKSGEVVAAGTPVVTVADTSQPYADVFVPQGDLAGIQIGVPASVRVDSLPQPIKGRVEYVSPRTEFTPRFLFSDRERPNLVIRVRIRIDDAQHRLHAGVPAFVTIERGKAAGHP